MSKYLILQFKNARYFHFKKDKSEYIFEGYNKRSRENEMFFIEPITVNHISNIIHVLFNQRPIPSFRKVFYKADEKLFLKAMDSFLKIDSDIYQKTIKSGEKRYSVEVMQSKKAVYNSWNPNTFVYWERVKKLLGNKWFPIFVDVIKQELKLDPLKISFKELKTMLVNLKDNSSEINSMFEQLNKNGKKSLYNYIYLDGKDINQNPRTALNVISGFKRVIKLKGEIRIPVNDDDLVRLNESKGTATILDGGLVYIKGVMFEDSLSDWDSFVKVSTISLEKK